ncbi:MAG: translation elongation factor 4 [Candidatus Paceibacterota bacterium]
MDNIRNFSIIAHIDHGKSTLADRMLEVTGTISDRDMQEQVLDQMDLERERGITIKMTPVTMKYEANGAAYELNLIDTPGHVDFSYEVSRAMRAVEGAVLLVDSTQGIEAQTLAVLSIAQEQQLTIVPAVTKIDAKNARPEEVALELAELLSVEMDDIARVSGKTGEGVDDLLRRVIRNVPAPTQRDTKTSQGLVFDFDYSSHRGIVAYTRIFSGEFSKNNKLKLVAADRTFIPAEVGVFSPTAVPQRELNAGSVGYVVTGIKEPGVVSIGDTITTADASIEPLAGYDPPQPVVWASVFPENQDQFTSLEQALERLLLTDSSLQYEREKSAGLGQGFRCGFLGRLHMEVAIERLRRDYNLDLITTSPSVAFRVTTNNGETETIRTPSRFPHYGEIKEIQEPWVSVTIRTPNDYMSDIMSIVYEHEGEVVDTQSGQSDRLTVVAEMPLRELMRGFFTALKQSSSGFASLSYEVVAYQPAEVTRLEVLVAGERVPALATIVSKQRVDRQAREIVEKLKDLLPQQVVSVRIQAESQGRIIASETLRASRKDVTAGLYGGDFSRKKKKLKAQREGKKKLQDRVSVRIPSEVYIKMMRDD